MLNDLTNKAVVITGGTMGIGLATGLAFGKAGAHVYLTHRWGSADEDHIRKAFNEIGARPPGIVEADASQEEDTVRLLAEVRQSHERVEVFVSNVCVVQLTRGVESLSLKPLLQSLDYSAWPLVSYVQQVRETFGAYPRYVIGVSSDGPDNYYEGYDMVAVSKTVMEVFGRYMAKRLANEDVRVNMVRPRNVITESTLAVHGADYPDFVRKYGSPKHFVQSEEVGRAILALCSGLLDAMSGQVLNIDRGCAFQDNLLRLFHHREEYGL